MVVWSDTVMMMKGEEGDQQTMHGNMYVLQQGVPKHFLRGTKCNISGGPKRKYRNKECRFVLHNITIHFVNKIR